MLFCPQCGLPVPQDGLTMQDTPDAQADGEPIADAETAEEPAASADTDGSGADTETTAPDMEPDEDPDAPRTRMYMPERARSSAAQASADADAIAVGTEPEEGDGDLGEISAQLKEMEAGYADSDASDPLTSGQSAAYGYQNLYSSSGDLPPYGAPRYGSPQYGVPQYGSPQYGVPQYGAAPYVAPQPADPTASDARDADVHNRAERPAPGYGDGYTDEPVTEEGKYRRISPGKRVGSVFMCIFMAMLMLSVVMLSTTHLALTDKNIRDACSADDLGSKELVTDHGNMTAAEFLREQIRRVSPYYDDISDAALNASFRDGRFAALVEDVLTDYADYFLRGKDPTHLNASYITGALSGVNRGISDAVGYDVAAFDTNEIALRIDGGDLSFLSIDEDGGHFYSHYGVKPGVLATLLSPTVLIICFAIVVLFIVLIFAINSSNIPTALLFNGVVMVIIGGLSLLMALGYLIVSFVKDIWIVTPLLRLIALWCGVIGLAIFLIGLAQVIIARKLKKKANPTVRPTTTEPV